MKYCCFQRMYLLQLPGYFIKTKNLLGLNKMLMDSKTHKLYRPYPSLMTRESSRVCNKCQKQQQQRQMIRKSKSINYNNSSVRDKLQSEVISYL